MRVIAAGRVYTAADPYLYHITLARNLDSIAAEGLFPGASQNWPGYGGHASGRLFLTESGGVSEWMHKVFYTAGQESDYPVEEGYLPVVLRVETDALEEVHPDELGSRDVLGGESFFVEDDIEPDALEVWVPWSGWVAVESVEVEQLIEYAYEHADKEEEDGEELVWADEDVFEPEGL